MVLNNVSEPIINHYITLINAGVKSIKDIPEKFQEEVSKILNIPLKELTLVEVKENKIKELSEECENKIYEGADITLPSDGKTYHFSFTLNDQNNIKTCFDLSVASGSKIPYHADGEACKLFEEKDLVTLYAEEQFYITKHTTFFNYLKQQIMSLETIDEVEAVTYETDLTGDFLVGYSDIITYSEASKNAIISTYSK